MRTYAIALAALMAMGLTASPALAGDFSEGSQAKEWGLAGEETATFSGRVVDILCELTGDCPADCGAGARQLGIVRSADDALVPVLKNGQTSFNGAWADLLPYCGKMVEVDGLLVGDEEQTPAKLYMIQLIREDGAQEWHKANRWTKQWAKDHPEAAARKGPWFRKDPDVAEQIEKHGYLGLGHEADKKFIEEWY